MFLFYQDISGALRQASYSKQSWTTDTSLIIPNTTDARNNTPLAATIQTLPDGSNEVCDLHYRFTSGLPKVPTVIDISILYPYKQQSLRPPLHLWKMGNP